MATNRPELLSEEIEEIVRIRCRGDADRELPERPEELVPPGELLLLPPPRRDVVYDDADRRPAPRADSVRGDLDGDLSTVAGPVRPRPEAVLALLGHRPSDSKPLIFNDDEQSLEVMIKTLMEDIVVDGKTVSAMGQVIAGLR